jgi:hypothetical protein
MGSDRWFHGLAAAAIVGAALAFAWRWGAVGRQWWAAAALTSLFAGGILYFQWRADLAVCTARRADGRRVIIGTEFTKRGRDYHSLFPNDDNDAILEALAGIGPQAAWTQTSINHCRLLLLATGTLWIPLFGAALICATGLLAPATVTTKSSGKKRVFISYNHADTSIAAEVRDYLRRDGFEVIFDAESMAPGGNITEFIAHSVRQADAIVSIVSTRSLLSAWVALETMASFEREKWQQSKVFVPCTLTSDFLLPDFRLRCTGQIDARIHEIESLLPQYAERKLDSTDLDQEKSRLYDLRNNLGKVLARLKDSLCLDLREEALTENLKRLADSLKGKGART